MRPIWKSQGDGFILLFIYLLRCIFTFVGRPLLVNALNLRALHETTGIETCLKTMKY